MQLPSPALTRPITLTFPGQTTCLCSLGQQQDIRAPEFPGVWPSFKKGSGRTRSILSFQHNRNRLSSNTFTIPDWEISQAALDCCY